ncbi:hypothetical protein TNCV_543472 [Trichonephila clavipes]|nr:hypothetical protein TNCV_543472 [Trichonephila clavipes]
MPAIIGYLNHWDTAAPDVVWKFGEWNASLDVAIEPRFKIMSSVDDDEQNWQFTFGDWDIISRCLTVAKKDEIRRQ